MKIVFNIKEDDARNPGVIADCTGDNAGDSVGPTADGFETYGVTGVALISFILLAVTEPTVQVQLLVWIFVMRVMMVIASGVSYLINEAMREGAVRNADEMNFEAPLTSLVWLTSIVSVVADLRRVVPADPEPRRRPDAVVEAVDHHHLRHARRRDHPGAGQGLHLDRVERTCAKSSPSSREGGASLNILSGLVAGNFSAYWIGHASSSALMAIAYGVSTHGRSAQLMIAPAVFAFGLVAFGFLGMGPVTIAVDSYGPVTDNAQSVFELSIDRDDPGHQGRRSRRTSASTSNFERAKHLLEENDGAGNTFKATAKPVLIGTAVVGATTMIFSIIVVLTDGLQPELPAEPVDPAPAVPARPDHRRRDDLLVHRRVDAGGHDRRLPRGRVHQGEHQARGRRRRRRSRTARRSSRSARSTRRRACSTSSWRCSSRRSAFAFVEPYFFIGYLISIALFGLFQAIFMANAGGAWDNAKKIVEVELKEKGTPLHAATVVGDTVGDPFKDTSSVALNPIIKFTTLFGLLAVELAVQLAEQYGAMMSHLLAGAFFARRRRCSCGGRSTGCGFRSRGATVVT